MLMWLDLLPQAKIAGLDLNDISIDDDSGRLHIYQGFQQDPGVLDQIAAEVAPDGFDVIVDDASHVARYTSETFWHLFPRHLKAGGIYVIDDWGCGYDDNWTDGHAYEGSREALGDFRNRGKPDGRGGPGPVERSRRRVRQFARPIASRLSPEMRRKLESVYMRAEGASLESRTPSHDYGMVGFIKQLVDATSMRSIDGESDFFDNEIESVHVNESQVFVHKRSG